MFFDLLQISLSPGNGFLDPRWLRLGSTRAWTEWSWRKLVLPPSGELCGSPSIGPWSSWTLSEGIWRWMVAAAASLPHANPCPSQQLHQPTPFTFMIHAERPFCLIRTTQTLMFTHPPAWSPTMTHCSQSYAKEELSVQLGGLNLVNVSVLDLWPLKMCCCEILHLSVYECDSSSSCKYHTHSLTLIYSLFSFIWYTLWFLDLQR